MNKIIVLFYVFVLLVQSAHIWPLPEEFTQSGDPINLSSTFTIYSAVQSNVLNEAIQRYTNIIGQGTVKNGLSSLYIVVDDESDTLGFDTDYSYSLHVEKEFAFIQATTPFGALYGLESFSQLIKNATFDHSLYDVKDSPVYKHRGIMIDTGRRFFPISTVKMILDSMPYNKLNVLHFHLSDWARVAVESKIYPQLTAGLVGDQGGFYTQEEITELVEYAKLRGVRVIPEIDVPGHCLGFKPLAEVGMQFCNSKMKQLYDDEEGKTFEILSTYLGEILPLFPEPFVHLGCDETEKVGVCTVESAARLEKKIFDFVYNVLGKRPIAWEESLFIKHSMIPEGIIDSWTNHDATEVLENGYDAVESSNKHFYIDHINRTYKEMWIQLSKKNSEGDKILFGGEVSMWTDNWCNTRQCGSAVGLPPVGHELFPPKYDKEFEEAVMSVIYPRTIVAAGTFWRYDDSLNVNSDEFYQIYDEANQRLINRGIITCPLNCKCDEVSKCGKKYIQH